jgi:murein DD-endopeptidase
MRLSMPLLIVMLFAGLFPALAPAAQPESSFDLRIPVAPMLRSVDGVDELVYELHLDNFALRDLKPLRVEVWDPDGQRLLAAYERQALAQRLDLSGVQWKADSLQAIASGRRGVVFIELGLADAPPGHSATALRTRTRGPSMTCDGWRAPAPPS